MTDGKQGLIDELVCKSRRDGGAFPVGEHGPGGRQAEDLLRLSGPRTDGGWSQAQERGRLEVERQFGDRVETSFSENVPESAAALPVFDKLAASGCNMIFATAFGYMDAVLAAAASILRFASSILAASRPRATSPSTMRVSMKDAI